MVVAHWALLIWFHVYSSLGWGTCFYAYFLLKKLVSGLLPTGGEGGLHEHSPLGVWLGFYGYFPLGNGYFRKINRKKKEKYMKRRKRTKQVDIVSLKKKNWVLCLPPFRLTHHWIRGRVAAYPLWAGVVGLCLLFTGLGRWFLVTSHLGIWFQGYSSLGRGWVA